MELDKQLTIRLDKEDLTLLGAVRDAAQRIALEGVTLTNAEVARTALRRGLQEMSKRYKVGSR